MTKMFNPPHPPSILREDVLPALGLTVSEAARRVSRVLNERAGISVELARRIEAWLGPENGRSAETWLRMQIDYDLWQSRKSRPLRKVKGRCWKRHSAVRHGCRDDPLLRCPRDL